MKADLLSEVPLQAGQYSPQQGGFDALKAAQTFRRVLRAAIDRSLPIEEKIEAISIISMMDYNELRVAVAALENRARIEGLRNKGNASDSQKI